MADEPQQDPAQGNPAEVLREALRRHQEGDAAGAIGLYRAVIAKNPDTAQLWCLLGVALKQTGDFSEAMSALRKAQALDPERPDIAAELGITCAQAGLAEEACRILGEAVPKLAAQGLDDPLVHASYGDACFALGRWQEAVTHYQATLAKGGGNAGHRLNLGVALHQLERRAEAMEAYRAVLEEEPDNAAALTNLGVALQEEKSFEQSLQMLQRALDASPEDALTLTDIGVTLQRLGRTDEAVERYSEALAAQPTYAKAWSNLGNAYQDRLEIAEAWEAHQRAVDLDPDNPELHWNLAMTLLLAGEYELGWPEYEWRRSRAEAVAGAPGLPWQGEPLDGKSILLIAEQGAGDAIQFARYAMLLARDGAKVHVRAHSALKRLLSTLDGITGVTAPGDPAPAVDYHAPLMSLAAIRGDGLDRIPASTPYLSVPEGSENTLSAPDGRKRIGLVWAGNPGHANDHNRSCPVDALTPLLRLDDFEFISLQPDARDIAGLPVTDISDRLGDFADTAAIMASLDLIIAVDTAAAHLAGALGLPVWVLLPYAPDWRWLTGRTDSPWYPTARLYRQLVPGDWQSVIHTVAADIRIGNDP